MDELVGNVEVKGPELEGRNVEAEVVGQTEVERRMEAALVGRALPKAASGPGSGIKRAVKQYLGQRQRLVERQLDPTHCYFSVLVDNVTVYNLDLNTLQEGDVVSFQTDGFTTGTNSTLVLQESCPPGVDYPILGIDGLTMTTTPQPVTITVRILERMKLKWLTRFRWTRRFRSHPGQHQL